ncbi:MAG TPA: hypothetical protein VK213_03560 [Bacteroidales bacterium]|nr:hypothetical protein [Bacteroidales bacterium]
MYHRDYILRMVEMVEQLIAAIISKLRKGETNMASEQLGNIYQDVFRRDALYLRSSDEMNVTGILNSHKYNNVYLEILADLYNADAEINETIGDKAGAIKYLKNSLRIYEFLDNETKTYSLERINKMESIRKRIDSNT